MNENTLILLLKTNTGIFQQTNPQTNIQQFFSLWVVQSNPQSKVEPINSEVLQSLHKLIQEKPEQFGSDLDNLKVVSEEYSFSNMEKLLKSEEDPKMDAYVASIIGDLEGEKAIPVLFNTLQRKEKEIYSAAFDSFLRLKGRYKEIPYLFYKNDIHKNKEFEFRFRLLPLFGESEDARLIEPLMAWMSDEEELLEFRKEAFHQLEKLTKKKFEYDFSERRSRQKQQFQKIQQWYESEKATLLAPYPSIAPTPEKTTPENTTETKTTPENTTETKTTPENTTETKTTPENTTNPDKTEKLPEIIKQPPVEEKTSAISQNTVSKNLSVTDLLAKEIRWNQQEKTLKEFFWEANQKALSGPFTIHTVSGVQKLPLKNGLPETQWTQGKKELKETLKQYLARSVWSPEEKQMIFKIVASFQKSTLILTRVTTYEILLEWATKESPENQTLLQSLLLPLREEDR